MFVRYSGYPARAGEYRSALESDSNVVVDSLSQRPNVSVSFDFYGTREGPLEMRWSSKTRDLFDLAGVVYIADELVARPETWHRQFDLHVPVMHVDDWEGVGAQLEAILKFLTGDKISISWSEGRPLQPHRAHRTKVPVGQHDAVCLFSGGLDSLTGAIRLLEDERRVLLVGHRSDGQASATQTELFTALRKRFGGRVDMLQCSLARSRVWDPEYSLPEKVDENHRSRSFLFLALGIAVAAAAGARELVMAENGLIALNPPLGPSRVGSLSTRTAHPRYLLDFVRFVRNIGAFSGRIWNPLLYSSKTDLLSNVQEWQIPLVQRSVSCSHAATSVRWDSQAGVRHCGHCVPCIFRRVAMMAAGLDDSDDYVDDVFGNLESLSAVRQQDMRMLIHFARRVIRANRTQIYGMVVAHGAFPPGCGAIIGPFESASYAPWGDMLIRWAREFLDSVE